MWQGKSSATLINCFTFHPNQSMGILHELSGYWILLNYKSFLKEAIEEEKGEGLTSSQKGEKYDMEEWEGIGEIPEWDLLLHRDLSWASMRDGSATRIRIRPGFSYEIHLSFRETISLNSNAYPCNPDVNYSRDKVSCYYII